MFVVHGYRHPSQKSLVHCTKMGADSLAENTPNAPEFISLKVQDFNEKRLHWASIVRGPKSSTGVKESKF